MDDGDGSSFMSLRSSAMFQEEMDKRKMNNSNSSNSKINNNSSSSSSNNIPNTSPIPLEEEEDSNTKPVDNTTSSNSNDSNTDNNKSVNNIKKSDYRKSDSFTFIKIKEAVDAMAVPSIEVTKLTSISFP